MTPIYVSAPSIASNITRSQIPCNQCGGQALVPFCPENQLGLVRCTQCDLVFVSERPDAQALEALYSQSYFANPESGKVGYTDYRKDEPNIRRTFARRLRWIERYIQPGKLLDVGCALGFFLAEAQQRSWQVCGLDVSQFAVDYTRDRFGFDVRLGSLLKQDFPKNAFDLVTLWDVIEHVADPKAYLQAAAKVLRPGGVVVLATPDVGSIPARLTGKRWVGYKLSEEHVYYFSRETLTTMLDGAGFEVVDFRHIGKFVTTSLFLNRLRMYAAPVAQTLALAERAFHLSERSLYVNPFDIMGIVARKRR